MWHILENVQQSYDLSDRLIRSISRWQLDDGNDSVEDLLARGADVNKLHGTLLPLHCACMTGDAEVVELLLQHGAEVNAVDGYCRTALHYAAESDESACVEILLAAGANVAAQDSSGDTPLHWASFRGSSQCVEALLQLGHADVNSADVNQATPLLWASKRPSASCIDILLRHNASPRVVDQDGHGPLYYALLSPPGAERDATLVLLLRATGMLEASIVQRLQNIQPFGIGRRVHEEISLHLLEIRSLCQLCRYAIRMQLGRRHLPDTISQLPLPKCLYDFLLLQK